MTDTTITTDQREPTFAEKAKDTLTDARYAATHSKEKFEEIADKIRGLNDQLPKPDAAVDRIADFTRRDPLTALGVALAVGLWINRSR